MSAEQKFRQSFQRLKDGRAIILSSDAAVTQNNVAREAGLDPTALKKARFPDLVMEIQAWVSEAQAALPKAQTKKKQQSRNVRRSSKQLIIDLKAQRDIVSSLLGDIDIELIRLNLEVNRLQTLLRTNGINYEA